MRSVLRILIATVAVAISLAVPYGVGWLVTWRWSAQTLGGTGFDGEVLRGLVGLFTIIGFAIAGFVVGGSIYLISESNWVHRLIDRIEARRKPKAVPLSDLVNSSKYDKERAQKFL